MDQIKIGEFIAAKRKENGLTQLQLAEKLNITDRAVSKWENGRSLPDSAIMLDLCRELGISVNDLLYGEVITMEKTNEKQEQQLLELIKQKEEADKNLLRLEIVLGILSTIILLVPTFIAAYASGLEDWQRILIVFSGFIPAVLGYIFCLSIERTAGYYECKHCNHKYVPTYSSVMWSMHAGRTRYMKCPKCGKKSWQKKVIKKD